MAQVYVHRGDCLEEFAVLEFNQLLCNVGLVVVVDDEYRGDGGSLRVGELLVGKALPYHVADRLRAVCIAFVVYYLVELCQKFAIERDADALQIFHFVSPLFEYQVYFNKICVKLKSFVFLLK